LDDPYYELRRGRVEGRQQRLVSTTVLPTVIPFYPQQYQSLDMTVIPPPF
jgi:hypothetical protein